MQQTQHISACVQGAGAESCMCTDFALLLDRCVQQQAYQTILLSFLQFHQNVIHGMQCCQLVLTTYHVEHIMLKYALLFLSCDAANGLTVFPNAECNCHCL